MCGITGFIDYQNKIHEQHLIDASTALIHRGGSGKGHFVEKHYKYSVGFANERLSTIDPSNDSKQPFTSSCGNYSITFNGTIYNYQDLRASFVRQGIIFKTLSDTEVLLECYKKWGRQLFEKIDGAYAFAILDRKRQQLLLARDSVGVKPLYWYKDKNCFLFSSEIKSLLKYPITKKIQESAIPSYLRQGYFSNTETIFDGIKNFKKQHYLLIDINSGNYFESLYNEKPSNFTIAANEPELIKQLSGLFTESILRRYTSDLSTGVMLSSGYDSALVAAVLQKNQAQKIKTFTLGFEQKQFDEADDARKIASILNTNHQDYYINDQSALEILEILPKIFDEPSGDSGAIPLAFLAQQISKTNVKVLLGAEGGDELFAGYTNYEKTYSLYRKTEKIPGIFKKLVINLSQQRKNKLKEVLFSKDLLNCYESVCSFFANQEISDLLNKDKIDTGFSTLNGNSIKDLLNFDINNYLPNDLLYKSDRISMFYNMDNRDSLLSSDLINFTKSLDEKWLFPNQTLKYLLKQVVYQYLPIEMMNRPKKGFSIPLTQWMSQLFKPHVEEYLSFEQLNSHRIFDMVEVFKIKNRFYNSPNSTDARKLWILLQFQMWYKEYFN